MSIPSCTEVKQFEQCLPKKRLRKTLIIIIHSVKIISVKIHRIELAKRKNKMEKEFKKYKKKCMN